jgi:hypothetical protein
MKHPTLIIGAAVIAIAGCSAQQWQGGSAVEYGANSTGTTPGWENTAPYPRDPSNAGYGVPVPPHGGSAPRTSR